MNNILFSLSSSNKYECFKMINKTNFIVTIKAKVVIFRILLLYMRIIRFSRVLQNIFSRVLQNIIIKL